MGTGAGIARSTLRGLRVASRIAAEHYLTLQYSADRPQTTGSIELVPLNNHPGDTTQATHITAYSVGAPRLLVWYSNCHNKIGSKSWEVC